MTDKELLLIKYAEIQTHKSRIGNVLFQHHSRKKSQGRCTAPFRVHVGFLKVGSKVVDEIAEIKNYVRA